MLKNLLVSEVRIRILDVLLKSPQEPLHVRAIVRKVGAEINAVRRELENLAEIKLLSKRQSSNRLYYSVNTSHQFYNELLSMLAKEKGLGADIIKHAGEFGDIEFGMMSLEFLRGRQASPLEVDIFFVGDINDDPLHKFIAGYEREMGREINYSTMKSEEFKFRKRTNDQFIFKVLSQSRTMLIGDEEKFYSIV
jgi:hypothetical protein